MVQSALQNIIENNSEHSRYDVIIKTLGTIASGYSQYIVQWGVIGDNTGLIRFTVRPSYQGRTIESNKCYSVHGAEYRVDNRTPNLIFDRGTTVTEINEDVMVIPSNPVEFDFNLPCNIVRVQGVCVTISDSVPRIVKQKGRIGNIEGYSMPFTIFNSSEHPPLEVGRIYDISFASVQEFGPRRELYLDSAEICEISSEQYPVDILTPFIEIDLPMTNACSKEIFPPIYRKVREILGLSSEEIQEQIRTPLVNARDNYSMGTNIDYSDRINQLAYMFGYFPYYIEPIRDTLQTTDRHYLDLIFHENMKINFYGCGPAPELLGFVRFLSENYPQISNIQTSFIDRNKWEPWRHVVINDISREYWGGRINILDEPEIDLLRIQPETISNADIHCIQNVCSDLIRTIDPARVAYWLRSMYVAAKPNSIIIVLDIQYSHIRTQIFEPARDMISVYDDRSIIDCPAPYARAGLDFIPSGIELPVTRQFTGYRHMTIMKRG